MHPDEREFYTVSQLNSEIREWLEEDYGDVVVMGEVSNFKLQSSGHMYFTLKDSDAQLSSACFRGDARRVKFEIEDGMKLLVRGYLTVYGAQGRYQLVARHIEEAGEGELEKAFRALCDKLQAEGLFDAEHKKELPRYPFRIGVITSPTGAAIRDITATVARRWRCGEIVHAAVRVQGEFAAREIVRAIERFTVADDLDVVIVGRGGGSLEDLWAFNEEIVARAIFACHIPIISAVGHESDVTIADFVADHRAATPTMAAEIAVPVLEEVASELGARVTRLQRWVSTYIEGRRGRLRELLGSYALGQVRNRLDRGLQQHDHVMDALHRTVSTTLEQRRARLKELMTRLNGLDAKAILSRGYAICNDSASGKLVGSAALALEVQALDVVFHDGSVRTQVKERVDAGQEK